MTMIMMNIDINITQFHYSDFKLPGGKKVNCYPHVQMVRFVDAHLREHCWLCDVSVSVQKSVSLMLI
jgi:hypothetical protein